MHQIYNPENLNFWLQYYMNQAGQTGYGSGLPAFRGTPYQRGAGLGSFFRSLFRMAVPVIKSVASRAGKRALTAGANIMADVAQGRKIGESVKERSREGAAELFKEAGSALEQGGQGLGIRPKSINVHATDVFNKKSKRKARKKK